MLRGHSNVAPGSDPGQRLPLLEFSKYTRLYIVDQALGASFQLFTDER